MPDPDDAPEPEVLPAVRTGQRPDAPLPDREQHAHGQSGEHRRRQPARGPPAPGRRAVLLQHRPQDAAGRARRAAGAIVYHNKLGTQLERVERVRAIAGAWRSSWAATSRPPTAPPCWPRPIWARTWWASSPSCKASWARTTRPATANRPAWSRRCAVPQPLRRPGQRRHADRPLFIAERAETLVGIWAIGLAPTGERDPFGLRRRAGPDQRLRAAAAGGWLKINQDGPLSLDGLLDLAAGTFPAGKIPADTLAEVRAFIYERYRNQLIADSDRNAVEFALTPPLHQVGERVRAVAAFAQMPEAASLAAANKRIGNLLKKAEGEIGQVNDAALVEPPKRRWPPRSRRCARRPRRSSRPATSPPACARWPRRASRWTPSSPTSWSWPRTRPCAPTGWPCWASCPDEPGRRHFQAGTVKLIILDRDGVINQDSDAFVKSPDEWIALPGSLQAIARLTQPAGRWWSPPTSRDWRAACSTWTRSTPSTPRCGASWPPPAAASTPSSCARGPDDNCVCRKPLPGMFEQIGARYDANLNDVPAVGDSLRDLQASSAAGCAPWLVLTGNGARSQPGRPAARHAHLRRPVGRGRPAVARQRGLTRWPGSVRCFTPFS